MRPNGGPFQRVLAVERQLSARHTKEEEALAKLDVGLSGVEHPVALMDTRPQRRSRDPGLLQEFAASRLFEGLAGLDPAAWRDPGETRFGNDAGAAGIGEQPVFDLEQQDATLGVQNDHAGGGTHDHASASSDVGHYCSRGGREVLRHPDARLKRSVGTLTFEGYPVLDEGGQTWTDDGSKVKLTFRDAAHNVTMVIGGDGSLPGVTANRMGPGVSGLPAGTPATATPTA